MLEGCADGCQMLLKCEGKNRTVTEMIPLYMLGGAWLLETLCKIINFVSMVLLSERC